MAKIYHAKQPVFGMYHKGMPEWSVDFDLVAEVEGNSLDEAFRLTNHIDRAWWDNPGVITHKKSRSTSVGDIIVTDDGTYRCETIGWTRI